MYSKFYITISSSKRSKPIIDRTYEHKAHRTAANSNINSNGWLMIDLSRRAYTAHSTTIIIIVMNTIIAIYTPVRESIEFGLYIAVAILSLYRNGNIDSHKALRFAYRSVAIDLIARAPAKRLDNGWLDEQRNCQCVVLESSDWSCLGSYSAHSVRDWWMGIVRARPTSDHSDNPHTCSLCSYTSHI